MSLSITRYDSPIGAIEIRATDTAVRRVEFVGDLPTHAAERETRESRPLSAGAMRTGAHPLLAEAERQLAAYFRGALRRFDLPLALEGAPFQRLVWRRLLRVGYGETASYQAIADAMGNPGAARAVGAANGRNPVAIIVPCHRIVGSGPAGRRAGQRLKLTGYSGGLWRKAWLLRHEGALLV